MATLTKRELELLRELYSPYRTLDLSSATLRRPLESLVRRGLICYKGAWTVTPAGAKIVRSSRQG